MNLFFQIKKIIKLIANYFEYDINKIKNKNKILNHFNIDLVLDVGANIGQTRDQLRNLGYKKKILSFEPLSKEHEILKFKSKNDHKWTIYDKCAIGNTIDKKHINVSKNSYSSSILSILPSHLEIAPESKYIDKEEVKIITLDSIFDMISKDSKNIYLKIDTQGYEDRVLEGLSKNINKICLIEIELSLLPLYKDQKIWNFFIELLKKKNFGVWSISEGVYNLNNHRTNQADFIFYNRDMIK